METKFADVILPVPIPGMYTYRVPWELNEDVEVGKRVVVQFGRSKLYSGIVRKVHPFPPQKYEAKYIQSVLDESIVVTELQFKFWEWIVEYYMCYLGDVMQAALPGGLKLSSETRIVLNPDHGIKGDQLTDQEYVVTEALETNEVLSLPEVTEILGIKTVYPIIKSLIEKKVVMIEEELKERYRPRMATYVRLAGDYAREEQLEEAFNQLSRAPKQLQLLMKFVELSRFFSEEPQEVKKLALQKSIDAGAAQVNSLVKKGIFELYEVEEGRLSTWDKEKRNVHDLSEDQQKAFDEIKSSFQEKPVCLLHGVTSSGKTEIYVKLIKETLAEGKQVLYLLPEIALTTQIINRLRNFFGDEIGVYHSKFNQSERVEIWKDLLEKKRFNIVLGARSALFLPFTDLGLIIVDEEHETTFKQYDPAPRYNARDASVVLAHMHGAKVLLGSATPSVESYTNAKEGKYGLVELFKRFGGVQLPEIQVADLKDEAKKKKMKAHFSSFLAKHIEEALENKEQIILFQNRRGFSPFIQCETCGWTPFCKRCDVGLTYHKYLNKLKCHYCGYEARMPKTCEACGSHEVKLNGFGTEKIEEDIELIFPKASVARMDLDTTRSKNAYQRIINDFEDRQIDILVGTQMVTKGLDFDNVALVGVLNADQMLNFQDFRAHERSYQLMSQVAGRAGRNKKRGKVIIQSYQPYHPIIRNVIQSEYFEMYTQQIIERRNFKYPPFYRLIQFTLKHKDKDHLNNGAAHFGKVMRTKFGDRVLGPEYPAIARIRNLYQKQILLKIEKTASIKKAKEIIKDKLIDFAQDKEFKSIRIIVDVDPI